MIRSRAVFARMLAAATAAHTMSALTRVCTAGKPPDERRRPRQFRTSVLPRLELGEQAGLLRPLRLRRLRRLRRCQIVVIAVEQHGVGWVGQLSQCAVAGHAQRRDDPH